MPDQAPEIEPAARQFAEDMTQANRMPFAALVMRQARAMSLIRHLLRSRRKWQHASEFYRRTAKMLNQAQFTANALMADLETELSDARGHAAWFAAEAAHWKTEADLYHTVAVQNYENDGATVASLDAERTELHARVAELEAAAERDHARIAGLELALQDRDSIYQHAGELEIRLNAANNEIAKLRGAPSVTESEAAHVKEAAGE